jgi:hypothetical protein
MVFLSTLTRADEGTALQQCQPASCNKVKSWPVDSTAVMAVPDPAGHTAARQPPSASAAARLLQQQQPSGMRLSIQNTMRQHCKNKKRTMGRTGF